MSRTLVKTLEDAYMETKDKAGTVMVWVLANLTRTPNRLYTSNLPLMWYPCSSRLTAEDDRKTNMEMLRLLTQEHNLNVKANSFDGKSRLAAVRSGLKITSAQ